MAKNEKKKGQKKPVKKGKTTPKKGNATTQDSDKPPVGPKP